MIVQHQHDSDETNQEKFKFNSLELWSEAVRKFYSLIIENVIITATTGVVSWLFDGIVGICIK